jgi:hypothetical protein
MLEVVEQQRRALAAQCVLERLEYPASPKRPHTGTCAAVGMIRSARRRLGNQGGKRDQIVDQRRQWTVRCACAELSARRGPPPGFLHR